MLRDREQDWKSDIPDRRNDSNWKEVGRPIYEEY